MHRTFKYVLVMSKVAESAPKSAVIGAEKKTPTSINNAEKNTARYTVLVNITSAALDSLRLFKTENRVAPPIPTIRPVPCITL